MRQVLWLDFGVLLALQGTNSIIVVGNMISFCPKRMTATNDCYFHFSFEQVPCQLWLVRRSVAAERRRTH